VALPEAAPAGVDGGEAARAEPAPGRERDSLRAEDRLPRAAVAPRVPGVERGLRRLLSRVARRDLGASQPRPAFAAAAEGRSAPAPDGGLLGPPKRPMHGGAEGLRRREEGQRAQAPPPGGHAGAVAGGRRDRRPCAGSRRGPGVAGAVVGRRQEAEEGLGGWRLRGHSLWWTGSRRGSNAAGWWSAPSAG